MLTEKVIELAKEYERTLQASAEDPSTLIGARKQYVDFLFDHILSHKGVFDGFSIMGAGEHGERELVMKYEDKPGYTELKTESGTISHYQFAAFQHDHTNYLLLRDDAASKVKLYITTDSSHSKPEERTDFRIGEKKDLNLLCRVKGTVYQASGNPQASIKRVNYDEIRQALVREVSREELINPQSGTGYYQFEWTKGRLFDEFYRGLTRFANECHEKLKPLKGTMTPQDINGAYQALQTLAKRL